MKTFCLRKNNKDWVVSTDRLKAASPMFGAVAAPGPPPARDDDGLDLLPGAGALRTDLVADPVAPLPPLAAPATDLVADPVLPASPAPVPGPVVPADRPPSPYRTRAGRASVPPERFVP